MPIFDINVDLRGEHVSEAQAPTVARKAAPAVAPAAQAAPTTAPAAGSQSKGLEPLKVGAIELEEFRVYRWFGTASPGTQPEDYERDHSLWALVGEKLHPYDRIVLVAKGQEWAAEFLVVECGIGFGRVVLWAARDLPQRREEGLRALPAGYEVRRGDTDQDAWIVIRTSDGWVMNVGQRHQSFEEARAWLLGLAIFRGDRAQQYLP